MVTLVSEPFLRNVVQVRGRILTIHVASRVLRNICVEVPPSEARDILVASSYVRNKNAPFVAMPGAPSSVLVPSSKARSP